VRPSKLTDELRDRITTVIRTGVSADVAAAAVGIAPRTYYRWMAMGETARSGCHRAFRDAVDQAKAESEVELVSRLETAARNGSWRAAAWLLERRFPERWGRGSVRTEASPAVDGQSKDPFEELDNVTPLKPRDR
jgi:hypothetical protein